MDKYDLIISIGTFMGTFAFFGIIMYVTYNQIISDLEYDKYIEELEQY